MKRIYLFAGSGIVILGTVHMLATLRLFDALTGAALWFFSGGMTIALAGAINLLNHSYGAQAPGLRRVCVGTNVTITVFAVMMGVVSKASAVQFVIVLGLCVSVTMLSLARLSLQNESVWKGNNVDKHI